MGSINTTNPKKDLTVRIFDEFNSIDRQVPAEEYDVVLSYFESVFGAKDAAKSFASALFLVAQNRDIPVLSLLENLQGQDSVRLTATMCYYLNGIRSPATLLGIKSVARPNVWAARDVLQ